MGTIYHAYCDESCTDKGHSNLVLAGVLVRADSAKEFRTQVTAWRLAANMKCELKWTRISAGRLQEYLDFMRMGISQIRAHSFAFRSLVTSGEPGEHADCTFHGRSPRGCTFRAGFLTTTGQSLIRQYCRTTSAAAAWPKRSRAVRSWACHPSRNGR
jgi:hypothetical protein